MQISDNYCCPRCHGKLSSWAERYECPTCGKVYPIIVGIPDFRLTSDRYISLEDDRAKGVRLFEKSAGLSFANLVRYYYSITPEVPADLAEHYTQHHLAGVTRGQGVLQRLAVYGFGDKLEQGALLLDLGCGTAGLAAAAAKTLKVTGVDIAFRWLVIGRKRLQELGLDQVNLVCAGAEHLPIRDQSFDIVTAEGLLEHTHTHDEIFREGARIRRPGGVFMARAVNRFAVGPEPHVGVWGVGFLPRRYMDPYVRRVKGIAYENIRLESVGGLRELIDQSGAGDLRVRSPHFVSGDYAHRPGWQAILFKTYNMLSRLPLVGNLLLFFGPFLDVVGKCPE